ncbi:MAG: tRNA (adenine-N1)-methyltransferase [Acidobacteriota bacterium]
MSRSGPRNFERTPFRAGEPVLIVDERGKKHVVHLQTGFQSHHGRAGRVFHDSIIGRPPGLRFVTEKGEEILCLRPTLSEYVLKKLKRRTQIIYPKDLGALLVEGNIYPGARVLEAGIGSGSVALLLRRFLGPDGVLISYEKREEFVQLSRDTLEEFQALYGGSPAGHAIRLRDVYEGIEETDLDTVILDVPEPHRAVEAAAKALRPNGILLCWLPTALQVFSLVRELQECPNWASITTTESLLRPWVIGARSIRPAHRMVAHTGFLVSARRVETIQFLP